MKIIIAVDDSPSSSELIRSVISRKWPADTNFKILTVLEPSCVSYADMSISEYAHTAAEIYAKRKAVSRAVVNHAPCSVEVVSTVHQRKKHAKAGAVAEKAK
jgi:nucleotide-binding universal stress UspA family protein